MEYATPPRERTVTRAIYDAIVANNGELSFETLWSTYQQFNKSKKKSVTKAKLKKAAHNGVNRGYFNFTPSGTYVLATADQQKRRHAKTEARRLARTKQLATAAAMSPNVATLTRNGSGNFELRMTLSERSAQDMALSAISGEDVTMKVDRLEYES